MLRILGVDPGGATGWIAVGIELTETNEPLVEIIDRGHVGDPDKHEHHSELENIMYSSGPFDLVVCERFEHRNNEFAELVSLEYIGVVKAFCQRYNIPLILQGSSQAKHWTDNSKLERLGLLMRPVKKWKDTNDSARHIVYFICCSNEVPVAFCDPILKARKALLHKLRPVN